MRDNKKITDPGLSAAERKAQRSREAQEAIAAPIRRSHPPHSVPTWLVLPMIVASAKSEAILGPYDLSAHVEAGGFKRLLDFTCVPTRMPDICDRAWKQHPGLPPIGAVVVGYFTELAGVEVYASALPPGWIVVHPIRRSGDHQVRFDACQQPFHVAWGCAVPT
jgi:hypothetical protein